MDDALFKVTFYDCRKQSYEFVSTQAFINFAKSEYEFWDGVAREILESSKSGVPPASLSRAVNSNQIFSRAAASVERFRSASSWSDLELSNFHAELNNALSKLTRYNWLSSSDPATVLWLESFKISNSAGEAFFNAITGSDSADFESFKGKILAYEAVMQDESFEPQRRAAEIKTFKRSRLKLVKAADELIANADASAKVFSDWIETTIDGEKARIQSQEHAWSEQMKKYQADHHLALEGCNTKLEEKERLLTEQLRMKGPASYWKKSAARFRLQGVVWLLVLIAWALLALLYFRDFFLAWANGDRMALNLASLEGAVIFAAIISSFIFMSRVFSKLAFSSFHLQRDSEEREQLTHLYLALSHDLSVDDETRKIVLQSLFSRSETGLLTNESGPTMPGVQDVVSSVIKRN